MRRRKEPRHAERTFERLTLGERLQHATLALSFTALCASGLPVRYHDTAWAGWLFRLMGGPEGRELVHRGAAVTMMLLALYHVFWLLFTERGRFELSEIMPRLRDALDAVGHLKYYAGLQKEPPRFGRFSYIEKFEYLALVWGTVVMAVTGMLLWFEVQAMLVLPKWVLDVCRIVHGYEALLAFLAIIVWHIYCVHFNPDVFPMSRVWLDGRITESDLKHHHPLEYERLAAAEEEAGAGSGSGAAREGAGEPIAAPTVKGRGR